MKTVKINGYLVVVAKIDWISDVFQDFTHVLFTSTGDSYHPFQFNMQINGVKINISNRNGKNVEIEHKNAIECIKNKL